MTPNCAGRLDGRPREGEKISVEARKREVEEYKPRFKWKAKNCRIKEQDSDREGAFGRTAASSRHYAEVRVRGKQVEEMHGKDIRNFEEMKSQSSRSEVSIRKVWTRR